MERFSDAVNGYVDVEDALPRYLLARAAEGFAAEREAKESVGSRAEFEARRDRVRERFRAGLGGLPERVEDPPVEVAGALAGEGYSVERLAFESRPDVHVTANCYVPDGTGPHPGVLFLPGHVDAAKADPWNQRACIELVRNGFVVLALDPLGQGEREQYRDPETGEAVVAGGGGVFAHCYAGQQCFYAGANLARFVIHDARCGLDYLHGRPDVDADRIGVTGASGGGVQTLYLATVDERVDAAAPCCAVTEREAWLRTGKRIDAEQVIHGAVPAGINFDDLLAAMAPRPVCVGAARWDEYFPIEGVHETVDRVRRVYDLYDAAGNVELVLADEPHCSVYELGEGVFEFLCDRLGDADYEPHGGHSVRDEEELWVTPRGSVRAAYEGERTIDALVREYVRGNYPDAGRAPAVEDRDGYAERLRERVVERLDLDRPECDRYPRYVDRNESDGLAVDHVFFKSERDPDVVVTGVLVSDPERTAEDPAVVLYEQGTEELPERTGDVASLAREHGTVLVFDPRGVGAVRSRAIPIPAWAEDYYGIYGTEFKLAYDALLLGTSLFGMRVYDVLRAAGFLRSATGTERVSFVGEGVGASHALYAAAVDRDVGRVGLRDLGPGFAEMATSYEYPYDPRLTVYDVVGDCDVPHVLAALEERGVAVERGGAGQ
ncbi:MAG: acetylxylan esterase [Haloarculaceae archaeon]